MILELPITITSKLFKLIFCDVKSLFPLTDVPFKLFSSFIDILSANSIFKGIERSVIGKITAYAGAHIEIFENCLF